MTETPTGATDGTSDQERLTGLQERIDSAKDAAAELHDRDVLGDTGDDADDADDATSTAAPDGTGRDEPAPDAP